MHNPAKAKQISVLLIPIRVLSMGQTVIMIIVSCCHPPMSLHSEQPPGLRVQLFILHAATDILSPFQEHYYRRPMFLCKWFLFHLKANNIMKDAQLPISCSYHPSPFLSFGMSIFPTVAANHSFWKLRGNADHLGSYRCKVKSKTAAVQIWLNNENAFH